MEIAEDSATATDRYTDEARQGLVDIFATLTLQSVISNPWVTVPEVLETLVRAGPLGSRKEILDAFRGGQSFRATVARTDIARGAALRGELSSLPFTTGPTAGEFARYVIP